MPNRANLRAWTDRSGTFKVDAEFLDVVEGKAHLHKTNGVKIAVPLEKLCPADIEFIKRKTNNSSPATSNSPTLSGRPRPGGAAAGGGGASAATLAAASAALASLPQGSGNFVYNGFNWRDWLVEAGVSAGDAAIYAGSFVNEKMDRSILGDLDRDVLRAVGVSEGDIIRIRRHAASSTSAPPSRPGNLLAERERLAQAKNLVMLNNLVGVLWLFFLCIFFLKHFSLITFSQ